MNILKNEYDGVPTLIMDLVEPDANYGRHGMDIRTILCPDGSIQIYHSNFLTDCDDYFQWSASCNSTMDFVKEEAVWSIYYDGNYAKIFAKDNKWIGRKIEGISELAETLCRAHKELLKMCPRYTAVGWDCMKTDQGYVVFEGNLARERLDGCFFSLQ